MRFNFINYLALALLGLFLGGSLNAEADNTLSENTESMDLDLEGGASDMYWWSTDATCLYYPNHPSCLASSEIPWWQYGGYYLPYGYGGYYYGKGKWRHGNRDRKRHHRGGRRGRR